MFDKLDGILERYDEIMEQLNDPNVVSDQNNFRKLMKEQSDLAPIVEAYKAYKEAKQTVEDSLMILDEESDEEMREISLLENIQRENLTAIELAWAYKGIIDKLDNRKEDIAKKIEVSGKVDSISINEINKMFE